MDIVEAQKKTLYYVEQLEAAGVRYEGVDCNGVVSGLHKDDEAKAAQVMAAAKIATPPELPIGPEKDDRLFLDGLKAYFLKQTIPEMADWKAQHIGS